MLDLSSNSFRGPFPNWICKLKWLSVLDLSNNLFNGSIPTCLRNSIVYLLDLSLRNNSFSGVLPDIFDGVTSLRLFDVSQNQLEGKFPKSLIHCKSLQLVNVGGNKIKDTFPSWLGSLPSLNVLSLRSNKFYGRLYHPHVSIGFQSLRVVDVSHNDFTGTLPPHYFSSWREMTMLNQGTDYMVNFMKGSRYMLLFPESIFRSMEMVIKGVETNFERIRQDFRAIDFSGNKIYGKIPESIGFLKELRLLNLSGNAFTSDIPRSLANLTDLEALDLSSNKLSGQIPQDFSKLSFLSYVNFSHNLLQGPVPRSTQFQRQKCSSFLDNPGLYGLEEICGERHVPSPTSQQAVKYSEAKERMINWVAAAIAYGPGILCGLVIGHIFTSHNQEWFPKNLETFLDPPLGGTSVEIFVNGWHENMINGEFLWYDIEFFSRSVRQTTYLGSRLAVDDLTGSRLAVDDLPGSRLVNAKSSEITDFKVNCKNNLCVDQTTYSLVVWTT
ncbi:hypothetical protein YC2023_079309 [Brassica napus]